MKKLCWFLPLWAAICLQAADQAWIDHSAHQVRMISHDGIRLECLDWGGRGETILFLAGLGNSGHIFDQFAPKFVKAFHVLALTRRGLGMSDKPETGYDIRTLVEDIRSCLDAQNIDHVILVGHSFGAVEAARFARAYPTRVTKLVYLDGAYLPSPERRAIMGKAGSLMPEPTQEEASTDAKLLNWLRQNVPGWNAACETDFYVMKQPRPASVFQSLMSTAPSTQPEFDLVESPSLAVFADDRFEAIQSFFSRPDQQAEREILRELGAFHHQAAEWFRQHVKNGKAVELADTDHGCFIQREPEVERLMREFLTEKRNEG